MMETTQPTPIALGAKFCSKERLTTVTKAKLQEIQSNLKDLDNTLNDARETESELPDTNNSEVLSALRELSYGLGKAVQSVARLQDLTHRGRWTQ